MAFYFARARARPKVGFLGLRVSALPPGSAPNQPALVALPSDTLQLRADENAAPSGTKRARERLETPSGEDAVQRACECAAAAISGLTNATVSVEQSAHAKALNEMSLATRALETQHAATVDLARTNAATVLSDFARATVSSKLLAHAGILSAEPPGSLQFRLRGGLGFHLQFESRIRNRESVLISY